MNNSWQITGKHTYKLTALLGVISQIFYLLLINIDLQWVSCKIYIDLFKKREKKSYIPVSSLLAKYYKKKNFLITSLLFAAQSCQVAQVQKRRCNELHMSSYLTAFAVIKMVLTYLFSRPPVLCRRMFLSVISTPRRPWNCVHHVNVCHLFCLCYQWILVFLVFACQQCSHTEEIKYAISSR